MGLGQLYTSLQALNAARETLDFQKDYANRNLANQAKMINTAYDDRARIAALLEGSVNSDGSVGATPQSRIDEKVAKAKEKHVDGSPIG